MKKNISGLLISCIIVTLLLSGCGGSSYATEEFAANDSYAGAYMSDDVYMSKSTADYAYEEAEEMPAEMRENGATAENVTAVDASRKIIRTVNLSVETEEFDKLLNNIKNKVNVMGGYLENTDISGRSLYSSDREKRYANITARVPSNKLDEFISNIAENSNVTNKSENAQDVTLSYTDTKAHIESLRVEQERLDELLKEAKDIETIVVIEDKRTAVRYEIESYESQLRTFDNKIDYSTVYLNISEVVEYTPDPEEEIPFLKRISEGFGKSLSDVTDTVVDSIADFIVNLPYIILSIISFLLGLAVFCIVLFVIIKAIIFISSAAGKNNVKVNDKKSNKKNALKKKDDTTVVNSDISVKESIDDSLKADEGSEKSYSRRYNNRKYKNRYNKKNDDLKL